MTVATVQFFHIEVDVIQTYMHDLKFNKSFVERAHMPRWKSNGRPIINVAPENVNMGSEYKTVSTTKFERDIDKYFEVIVVTATESLNYKYPNSPTYSLLQSGVATPMIVYMILLPKEPQRDKSLKWRARVNGVKYLYNWNESAPYMTGIAKALTLITHAGDSEVFANRIVNISYLPFFPYDATLNRVVSGSNIDYEITIDADIFDVQNLIDSSYHAIWLKEHAARRIGNAISTNIYDRLKTHYSSIGINESKLLMYPFSIATLYDNLGNAFEIKPQYTNDGNINIDALTSISASPKAAYLVKDYAGSSGFNNAIISNVNADIEVVNDNSATYMQGKKNSDSVAASNAARGGFLQSAQGVATGAAGIAVGAAGAVTLNPILLAAGAGMMLGGLNNTYSELAAINARQEDMKNIPPSVSGQVGATNLAIGYELILPRLEIKNNG